MVIEVCVIQVQMYGSATTKEAYVEGSLLELYDAYGSSSTTS
jgi:hypothetical protein